MSVDRGDPTFDRELDAPRLPNTWPEYSEIRSYYRVLVNPFLAVLGWLTAVWVIRLAMHWRRPWMLLLAVLNCRRSFLLFQFHCLDCGKTGLLHRLGRHRCDAVWQRWETGDAGRWRTPSVAAQFVIWFYVAVGAAALIGAFFYVRR